MTGVRIMDLSYFVNQMHVIFVINVVESRNSKTFPTLNKRLWKLVSCSKWSLNQWGSVFSCL